MFFFQTHKFMKSPHLCIVHCVSENYGTMTLLVYLWWIPNFSSGIHPAEVMRSCPSMTCRGVNNLLTTDPWLCVLADKPLTFCREFSCTDFQGQIDNKKPFILSPNFLSLFDVEASTGLIPNCYMSSPWLLYSAFFIIWTKGMAMPCFLGFWNLGDIPFSWQERGHPRRVTCF